MRVVGIGLLALALVMGGAAAVDAKSGHAGRLQPCTLDGVSYPVSSYCYTSCDPKASCEVLVCFTGGTAGGEWNNVCPCKQRDCRKVCL